MSSKSGPTLDMWVIYDHPADYPDVFIARRHLIGSSHVEATDDVIRAPELDTIRSLLAQTGKVSVARSAEDDPVIVETWL